MLKVRRRVTIRDSNSELDIIRPEVGEKIKLFVVSHQSYDCVLLFFFAI